MRVIGSVEIKGMEYQSIWAALSWINNELDGRSGSKALTVRDSEQQNQTIIPRNAKLASVETSLRYLRGLGFKDSQLCELFNYKGNVKRLSQHIKELVSSLN
ncbi:MAG: hypothetical protein M3O30_10565 [Planctomycetota bacterium]|nr:hypothetical protein [Planctomycetota bacterium]